ncbi:restriction endonuclease subunit S [Dactylosporangium matsuzakiense]|uniref:Specificity protein S n=1 Tax=Dactylosporangium matsuzakiense TaxID=53360 RepID=A0A9W6KTV7_9ACTN|nr:restriction endonuclease subunit S [Dactylosporangium matsuzakiense]UWZ43885.1 restriction endonuclease subunit S [Dactylosporangium matsuzakiense]GLL06320.1 specificity protein S [Dactylosporangium matsuzakiense]
MPDFTTTFSKLVSEQMIEIGAGRPRTVSLNGHDLPVLRVADVLDGRIESAPHAHTSRQDVNGEESKVSRPGDIVLTTKGTVGRVALMPADGPVFAYSPQLCYFRPVANGPLRSRFLYYWFKSTEFWIQAEALKGQTDMADFLSLGDIQLMHICIPSVDRQDAVAGVLGALDDKIAANNRIARLVDDLLSERFASIGACAPVGRLSDVASVNVATTRPQPGGQLRYLDISAVSIGSYEMPPLMSWDEAPGRARRVVKPGDTVWSTVRPNRRSHALILDRAEGLIASTGLAVISPASGRIASVYESTRTDGFVSYLDSVAEGSAYPAVRAEKFLDAPVPHLPPESWDEFESLAFPMRERAAAAMRENRALTATRDELLPLLMSGRIRVRDAEKIMEEVV